MSAKIDISEVLARSMLEKLSYIETHTSQTSERLATGVMNNVLEVGSQYITAAGAISLGWGATCGAIEVRNHGEYIATVASGMPGVAPIQGVGVSYVGGGSWRIINVNSRTVTIYGTPGELIGYQAFTTGLPPGAGIISTAAATAFTLSGSSQLVAAPPTAGGTRRYYGVSLRETGGTNPAVVRVWGNTAASGLLLDTISLTASQSTRDDYPGRGLAAPLGIYLEILSGTVEGSVRYS